MKIPKSVSKLLENKYVLYVILFLAVTNMLGYMVMGNITPVIFFIIVGYLVSIFSKNMIIVLIVPLLLTNILMAGSKAVEGFSVKDTTATDTATAAPVTTTVPVTTKKQGTTAPAQSITSTPISQGSDTVVTPPPTHSDESGDQPQGMTTMYKKTNRIDYAATVEDAYEDLNKILGGDGIKRLTDDTQRLMQQQVQLADAMKSMTPLLEQAKGMLQGFDLKNLDGLASMAKQFANTK